MGQLGPTWEIIILVSGIIVSAVINLLGFAFLLGKRDTQIVEIATRQKEYRTDMEREWIAAARRSEKLGEGLSTTNQKISAMTGKVNGESYRLAEEK